MHSVRLENISVYRLQNNLLYLTARSSFLHKDHWMSQKYCPIFIVLLLRYEYGQDFWDMFWFIVVIASGSDIGFFIQDSDSEIWDPGP